MIEPPVSYVEALTHKVLSTITKMRSALIFPDAVILHPNDWRKFQNFEWQATGKTPIQKTLWNLPIIVCDDGIEGKPMVATWGVQ
jgi:hypothetical protein